MEGYINTAKDLHDRLSAELVRIEPDRTPRRSGIHKSWQSGEFKGGADVFRKNDNVIRALNITVGIADMKVSDNPCVTLVTHALGSCIGLAVYDPVVRVGGLLPGERSFGAIMSLLMLKMSETRSIEPCGLALPQGNYLSRSPIRVIRSYDGWTRIQWLTLIL